MAGKPEGYMQKEQSQRNVCKASLAVFYKFYKFNTGLRVLNFCSSIEQKKKHHFKAYEDIWKKVKYR